MKIYQTIIFLLTLAIIVSCSTKEVADIIIHNGKIYTVDTSNLWVGAVAVKNGKIVETANGLADLNHRLTDNTDIIDLKGNFMMPGFIEGHGHFSMLGKSLIDVNLLDAKSWEEVVERVAEKVKEAAPGEWIEGRGWHQEKWIETPSQNVHGYPYNTDLNTISPDNPVVLIHASGHSLMANEKALEAGGINLESKNPFGGEIVRDHTGKILGVLEERAMTPVRNALNDYIESLDQAAVEAKWHKAIEFATDECLKKGITSFQDAGSKLYELPRYKKLAEDGSLDLRLWVMARDTFGALNAEVAKHKVIGVGNNFYTCNAIKSEVDGALGAFGAWLLEPYNDKPGFVGQNTTDIYDVKRIADLALELDMQFCVHAIGDRANRVVLDIYENLIGSEQADKKEYRWRIEHAQHLNPSDIPRFAQHGIIASMQGIHCTSDSPFVVKRLGEERSRLGAYAWRSLIDAGVIIANGTDAPVEDVDPLKSFYASVTRKREDREEAFFSEQSMTRAEAIHSYTLGNAYAAFEEQLKGTIEVGKVADFVVLDKDLINCEDEDILHTQVLYTIVDGQIKFKK